MYKSTKLKNYSFDFDETKHKVGQIWDYMKCKIEVLIFTESKTYSNQLLMWKDNGVISSIKLINSVF